MCYHKQNKASQTELTERYHAALTEPYKPLFHENGFNHMASPVLISVPPAHDTEIMQGTNPPVIFKNMSWGLIPFWIKSTPDALQIRIRTLNAISEEAFEKPSFRDSIRKRRCLVPCTGFYEWRWGDSSGKVKYPYFIKTDQPIFSLAGIWSEWENKETGTLVETYSVLTTRANPLMEKIHNSKKRMPVILPMAYERDWLNPNLSKEDILALCQPYATEKMDAWTISRQITSRTAPKNTEEIFKPFRYPELDEGPVQGTLNLM